MWHVLVNRIWSFGVLGSGHLALFSVDWSVGRSGFEFHQYSFPGVGRERLGKDVICGNDVMIGTDATLLVFSLVAALSKFLKSLVSSNEHCYRGLPRIYNAVALGLVQALKTIKVLEYA
jgi:hypothetical protein